MSKCAKCGAETDDDASIEIRGVANVVGYSTIEEFKEEGVEWTPIDSWDEVWVCNKCGSHNPIYEDKKKE